ncbi:hypothetical protein ACFSQJ_19780 [Croceitalea marina]|uniref:Uncharacterized protein n=1 Tax=Croceitalea marina TaxID=1775166 RepID=A0ABW5N2S7_9FLAO
MEEFELKALWSEYDKKIDDVISYNEKIMEEIMKQNAKNSLAAAKPVKKVGILIGIPWILFLAILMFFGFKSGNLFFSISFLAILICTVIALATYIYHLVLINQINVSNSVLEAQRKIAEIKISTLVSTRIVFLQLPFWTTWYLQASMLESGNTLYWAVNILITSIFALISIWLFRMIRADKLGNKKIKWLFSDTEWKAVVSASDILNQIEYSKE